MMILLFNVQRLLKFRSLQKKILCNFTRATSRIYERIRQWPVTDTVFEVSYSGWNLVQWLMSRIRNWCKVFESRTVADVPQPCLVLNIWKSGLRDVSHRTRRQSRIFDGHCTRSLASISVTGHWRILSYVRISMSSGIHTKNCNW